MMAAFSDRLRAGLANCGLEGASVLAAVSGGADSVALLRGMLQVQSEMRLRVTVAHLDHNLRDEASRQDAEWLTDLCAQLGVPLVVGNEDVAQIAQSRKQGIEETARQVRYAFLEQTAREQGCPHVAVAHTANDQIETILHHILRGTGLSGLQGMRPVRRFSGRPLAGTRGEASPLNGDLLLVRPMLEITRREVQAYLAELGQDFRTDLTNVDERFTRSRIRSSLLPLLEREYNPQVGEAVLRLGRQARDIQQALERLTDELISRATEDRTEHVCRLNCEVLAGYPRHLVRECLSAVWRSQNWPLQPMGFVEWDRLADLVTGEGALTLPGGIEARRRGNLLVLHRR